MINVSLGYLGIGLGLVYAWLLGKAGIKFDYSGWIFYIIATYLFIVGVMLSMRLL